jgi:hypothetical protein
LDQVVGAHGITRSKMASAKPYPYRGAYY